MRSTGRMGAGFAFFIDSLATLAAIVFLYIYLSGGGELGRKYLSAYYPLAALALVLLASIASGRSRKEG